MADEQMRPLLKAWFRARSAAPADVTGEVAEVMVRLPQTQQRSRWWPLPGFDRSASIPLAHGPTPARGFSMFSAIKFITTSVILTLFGGFLLAGSLSMPYEDEVPPAAVTGLPTPMTSEEVLSGMITEELEPGVYKVVNDGRRDLMHAYSISVGADGSVWGLRDDGFFRLGGDFTKWPGSVSPYRIDVALDGTVWAGLDDPKKPNRGTLRTFDGKRWRTRKTFTVDGNGGVMVAPDGTVLGWWPDPDDKSSTIVARYEADGWQRLGDPVRHMSYGLQASAGDDVWVMSEGDDGKEYLRQFTDGGWVEHGIPISDWVVGLDGTVLATRPGEWRMDENGKPVPDEEGNVIVDYRSTSIRFDGEGWQEFSPEDGAREGFVGLQVAADGSIWATLSEEERGGLQHFDGEAWSQYLPDLGIDHFRFGPDGAVWLLGGLGGLDEGNWFDLYVITPEAVTATEQSGT